MFLPEIIQLIENEVVSWEIAKVWENVEGESKAKR